MTHPYRLPTISGLYETCAAGGGSSKLYRPRFPFSPDEVVGGCRKSFVSHHLPDPSEYHAVVPHPCLTVPQEIILVDLFDWLFTVIGENRFAFSDTCELRDFAFLPEMTVDPVLFDGYPEHLAGALTVDIAALPEQFHAPLFSRQPRDDPCLDG